MNRYVVDGLLADMRAGRNTAVIGENMRHARHIFEICAGKATPGEVVRRTNGNEAITGPTGSIRFASVRSSVRGWSADVVYVDAEPTIEQLRDIELVTAAGGETILR